MIRTLLQAPIRFDALGGEQLHAPMVLATVGASAFRLVLDTGSDVHLLTREVADRLGIDLAPGEAGTGHAGEEMDSWLAGTVTVEVSEALGGPSRVELEDVVVIPGPPPFERWGIGGALSPQRLSPTGWTVLDLVRHELWILDATAVEVREWMLGRRPSPQVLELIRAPGSLLPIIDAAIEPFPEVPVLVNTGGRHTEFEPGVVPGVTPGETRRIGGSVSGADVMGATAGPQVLRIGEHRIPLPNLMLREGMSDPPAMIGSDVLRGTVLAVAADPARPVLWQVEDAGPRAG